MQIKQKKSSKKIIILTILLAVIIFAGICFVYIYTKNNKDSNGVPNNSEQDLKKTASELDKNPNQQNAANDQKQNTVNDNIDKPTNSVSENISVTLSASNKNGDVYQIRYLIQQAINEGTCTLVLTKDSDTVTKTASVQFLSSYSTCQGFNIPTSELGSGKWQAILTVKSGNSTGSTVHEINL